MKHLRAGQRTIACASSKETLAQAKHVGADQLINHAIADVKTALKKPLVNVMPAQVGIYTLLIFLDFRLFPTFARTTGNDESTIKQRFLKEATGGKAIDDLANHRAAGKPVAAI